MIDKREIQHFYLTDLVNTPTYISIQFRIQAKYARDVEGEWPEEYYAELTQAIKELFQGALEHNVPQPEALEQSGIDIVGH